MKQYIKINQSREHFCNACGKKFNDESMEEKVMFDISFVQEYANRNRSTCFRLCWNCTKILENQMKDARKSFLKDKEIEKLWDELKDVPIDEDECLDIDWQGWNKGTHREEIWYWFDEHHSKGVGWLMNERERRPNGKDNSIV